MSLPKIIAEQYTKLPVVIDPGACSGKTYIVTGANSGLGLETARHLVRCSAARVILTVRNLAAGEKAKADIERTTGRTGVAEVWKLDLASYASVKEFADKASAEIDRIDALIENAGILLDKWTVAEGTETSMTVNVISTILLGILMMPKLVESAQKFGIKPRIVFLTSALGFNAEKDLAKGGKVNIFDGLNNPKKQDMAQRYSLTKLVEMYAVREFAAACPEKKTGVTINMVAPGICQSGLARDASTLTRATFGIIRTMWARTSEEGSRTVLHALFTDEETHGKHLSGCKIKEYWIAPWMTSAEGQSTQKQIWRELLAIFEDIRPGCTSRLLQSS